MRPLLDRYEIERELGRGGMASVVLAHDPRFGREVAIKVLPREFLHDPAFRARFEREARVIAALEHPAIVPVYDFGEHQGQPYLVMRYMAGGSLADRLTRRRVSPVEAAQILAALAPALDKAHRAGVVHRDLKPANILFDADGNPAIADFGIAKLVEAGGTYTSTGIIGTPAYMSPEQVEGERALDGRSDVYALGVILYELLAGNPPYQADTPMSLALMHLRKPVPHVHEAVPGLPPAVDQVVAKALAKDREDRYASAPALANAFVSALQGALMPATVPMRRQERMMGAPPAGRTPPPAARTPSAGHGRRRWTWLVVPLGVAAVGLTAASLLGGRAETMEKVTPAATRAAAAVATAPRPQSETATTDQVAIAAQPLASESAVSSHSVPFPSDTPEPPASTSVPPTDTPILPTHTAVPPTATLVPPTPTMLVPTNTPAPPTPTGFIRITPNNIEQIETIHILQGNSNSAETVAFSPDGSRLATASAWDDDNNVRIWSANDGELLMALPTSERVNRVAFSPDGGLLAATIWDLSVQVWNTDTGDLETTLSGHATIPGDLAFSVDGTELATGGDLGSGGVDGDLILWRTKDWSREQTMTGDWGAIKGLAFSSGSLAAGGLDGKVRAWFGVYDNPPDRILEGHGAAVNDCDFSPDDRILASGSSDQTVRLWKVGEGTLVRTLEGHASPVNSVAFSPDGALLAAGTEDGRIFLWRVSDGSLLRILIGHSKRIPDLAFSPDGARLASASWDGTVRVWGVLP